MFQEGQQVTDTLVGTLIRSYETTSFLYDDLGRVLEQEQNRGNPEPAKVTFRRFFVQDTASYPGVGQGRYAFVGQALRRLLPWLDWEQNHTFIQQRWFRPGSQSQWYPNNPVANRGLQRLGNAGWNLVPIPRQLNGLLGQNPWLSVAFGESILVGAGYGVYRSSQQSGTNNGAP